MSYEYDLHLFEATGIELEYMIVDRETLSVRPIADELLRAVGGGYEIEVDHGATAWSNELALHVIETKTNGPVPSLDDSTNHFQADIRRINALLEEHDARLMPGGMHPWMDPDKELSIWPHENDIIYRTFDRIFDCRGHGWANLQSMHINLPFGNDDEFGRLHAAIRLILPLLPAIAASSPFADGEASGFFDTRMEVYRRNARRVPSVSGQIIPERVFTREAYERDLLGRIYDDLRELDPNGTLHHEWVNSRGAIARFDRGAIEIRVIDLQECPMADIAIAQLVIASVEALVAERFTSYGSQTEWGEENLAAIFKEAIRAGDETVVRDTNYLRMLGFPEPAANGQEVWQHLLEITGEPSEELETFMKVFLSEGCLARRIAKRVGKVSDGALRSVYAELCEGLENGRILES